MLLEEFLLLFHDQQLLLQIRAGLSELDRVLLLLPQHGQELFKLLLVEHRVDLLLLQRLLGQWLLGQLLPGDDLAVQQLHADGLLGERQLGARLLVWATRRDLVAIGGVLKVLLYQTESCS